MLLFPKIAKNLLLVLVMACLCSISMLSAFAKPPQQILPVPTASNSTWSVPSFSAIHVSGDINVTLVQITNGKHSYIQLSGDATPFLRENVKDRTLYLKSHFPPDPPPPPVSSNKNQPPPPPPPWAALKPLEITLGINELTKLIVTGNASVSGIRIHAPSLLILSDTTGRINLRGMLGLNGLLAEGTGPIDINWVNSKQLRVTNTGKAHIRLAGTATDMMARLSGTAYLDAQYLRTKNTFVQTKDSSFAKVIADNNLRAFAYDASNIYFYKKPLHLTQDTTNVGNVLQMDWRH